MVELVIWQEVSFVESCWLSRRGRLMKSFTAQLAGIFCEPSLPFYVDFFLEFFLKAEEASDDTSNSIQSLCHFILPWTSINKPRILILSSPLLKAVLFPILGLWACTLSQSSLWAFAESMYTSHTLSEVKEVLPELVRVLSLKANTNKHIIFSCAAPSSLNLQRSKP